MIGKCIAGFIVLVFLAVSLQKDTQSAAIPQGAILSGSCSAGSTYMGVPGVVFGLGESGNVQCAFESGVPTRGIPMPSGGTLQKLQVVDDAANQGSTVIVYVNGQATALTCTENALGRCTNTTARIHVRSGDQVAATYTSSTGDLSDAGMLMALEKL